MAGMKELASQVKQLEEQLVVCIRCGMCQAVCPLFEQTRRESDVARGKLALLDGLMKNMFTDPDGVSQRLNKCLLCGSCAANCPSGVNVVEIFIRARAILAEFSGLSPAKKAIFRRMLGRPETFDRITEWAGRFQSLFIKSDNNLQGTSCARIISPLISGRHLLPLADRPFHAMTPGMNTPPGKSGLKVAVFTGCLIDKIFPRIAEAMIDVLSFHGVGIYIAEGQGCCGIPALASGDRETFDRLVDHNVELMKKEKFDYCVTACATCTSTIRKLWPALFRGSGGQAQAVRKFSEKTLDIHKFLVNSITLVDQAGQAGSASDTVTYHDPCHLKKSLGVAEEPRKLIRASGNILKEMAGSDKCCGMGGSFNAYHYDISSSIGTLKQKAIVDTGATTVATGCPACMMQISDMLARNNVDMAVKHPIELYREALRNHRG
ncbi:MAG: (Fe-S)-binding protein [Pseudomonadota bacterium]